MSVKILRGDCREVLRSLPDKSVHCVLTSPPYFGLRNYRNAAQIGLEPSVEEYVDQIVGVLDECGRTLRDDGTLWLNLGDSYAGGGKGGNPPCSDYQKQQTNRGSLVHAGYHERARVAGAVVGLSRGTIGGRKSAMGITTVSR